MGSPLGAAGVPPVGGAAGACVAGTDGVTGTAIGVGNVVVDAATGDEVVGAIGVAGVAGNAAAGVTGATGVADAGGGVGVAVGTAGATGTADAAGVAVPAATAG